MVRKYLQDARAHVARLLALAMATIATFDAVARKRIADRLFALALDLRGWPRMAGADDETAEEKAAREAKEAEEAEAEEEEEEETETAEEKAAREAKEAEASTDWKAMARKHERRAKKEKERADKLAADQKKADDEQKSETQKAIDKAREDGKTEALTESQKERRADRLENSVIRLAAKGVTVGEGDDAKTLKFDDPEDALTFIERAIAKGDIDEDDIFDDGGKVKSDAVEEELAALLKRKPRLAAGESDGGNGGGRRAKGDGDGGKGKGGSKSLDEMSPDEHLKAIQQK